MKRAKTYFRILIDDSPAEDFTTLDAALRALLDPGYTSIHRKRLVSGHWQGKGEWVNFVVDNVIL